jgi:hypothetical protein
MPEATSLVTVDIIAETSLLSELSPLFLPHALPPSLWNTPLANNLANMEAKLQSTQAFNSLAELCQCLCVSSHLMNYKHQEV